MTYSPFKRKEQARIHAHTYRVEKLGMVPDLRFEDWNETIQDFNGLCAYCKSIPFQEMDHFIPVIVGGNTTISNCVPCCAECNSIKGDSHPDAIQGNLFFDIEGVRTYLSKRQAKDETYWINIHEWYTSAETQCILDELGETNYTAEELSMRGVLKVHVLSYDLLYSKKSVDVFCKYKRGEIDSLNPGNYRRQ